MKTPFSNSKEWIACMSSPFLKQQTPTLQRMVTSFRLMKTTESVSASLKMPWTNLQPYRSNQLYALVKKTVDVPRLHGEIFLKLGLARYYKVLSFRGLKRRKVLLIECTPLEKVQQVIDERIKKGYALEPKGGESLPMLLRQTQRLRIDITGKILKDVMYPNSAYFITVLFDAHDPMTPFSFKISAAIGGTYFGNLNILSDKMKRGELFSSYFDPDM
ncbi:hypothetical protein CHS0354_012059 [Potamilus streckersoni]|uniref:Uncharacterized protein n=1 Tax=Potamilus streckersoni TaxID=2493646 RepID=A0AAE0RQF9_9BIVA|nr:hypothetical protein CHS0354_012059 [Potamilus streckersoni]